MYVLAFRDMTQKARGAVTAASLYEVKNVGPSYAWNPVRPLDIVAADVGKFSQDVAGAHVGFIVHGYNVDRNRGFAGGGAMAQEFEGQGPLATLPSAHLLNLLIPSVDVFIPVLWPGDWFRQLPINYPLVLKGARAVGRNFAQFLGSSRSTMRRVSFFSHSYGARVVLETMQNVRAPQGLVGMARNPPVPFDTAILTAAAASETVLDSPFYAAGLDALRRIVVVSAATDEVLTTWFPIGNAVEKALWKNDPGPNVALGRDGPVLTANSPARRKTEWFVVTDAAAPGATILQKHGDYMPEPDEPVPPLPNGWTAKRERIATLTQAVFNGSTVPWAARPLIPET